MSTSTPTAAAGALSSAAGGGARADEIAHVEQDRTRGHGVEVDDGPDLRAGRVEDQVLGLGVVVDQAQGQEAVRSATVELGGQRGCPAHARRSRPGSERGPPGDVGRHRRLERRQPASEVVEAGDGLDQRRTGQVGQAGGQAGERAGRGPGLGGVLEAVDGAPLDEAPGPPHTAVGVDRDRPAAGGGHGRGSLPTVEVGGHPGHVGRQAERVGEHAGVEPLVHQPLERPRRQPVGGQPGLVDVAAADRRQPEQLSVDREQPANKPDVAPALVVVRALGAEPVGRHHSRYPSNRPVGAPYLRLRRWRHPGDATDLRPGG